MTYLSSMAHLEIRAVGMAVAETRELPSGKALLVGRSPDPARVEKDATPVAIRS